MGRPLSELTKAELIEALEHVGRLYHKALKRHERDMDMLDPERDVRFLMEQPLAGM